MSHFSVIVVTDEPPNADLLRKALMPWHEFECTGEDNEYVQEVDQTEEAREAYEKDTTSRLRAPDGSLHEPCADRFYRDPTDEEAKKIGHFAGTGFGNGLSYHSKDWDGNGYRTKVRFVPDGYVEVELPRKDVEPFRDFVESYYGKEPVPFGHAPDLADKHKYGYAQLDKSGDVVRVIDRTNPNKKWDWFQVGGRYSGRLIPKRGAIEDAAKGKRSWTNESDQIDGFDTCRWGSLDKEAMAAQQRAERLQWIDSIVEKSCRSRSDVDIGIPANKKFHDEWLALPEPRPRGDEYTAWLIAHGALGTLVADVRRGSWELPEVGDLTVQQWIDAAPPLSCWAFVIDGEWHETGRMGWFGVAHDEKPDWENVRDGIFGRIKPHQFISVVDCHI